MTLLSALARVALPVLVVLLVALPTPCIAIVPSNRQDFTLNGFLGDWTVSIRPWKGTISAIRPNGSDFSFINDDSAGNFSSIPRHHSHGDITFLIRTQNSTTWRSYTTADSYLNHSAIIITAPPQQPTFDVTPLLRPGHGVQLTRAYTFRTSSNSFQVTVTLRNLNPEPIEVGGFGVSALFSSNWNDLDLSQAAAKCSLAEPSITGDHGWVKVTRLTGEGPVLLMSTVPGVRRERWSGLQRWRQLKGEDATPTGYAFEGHYEWTSLTAAYDEADGQPLPWTPTTPVELLKPNDYLTFHWQYEQMDNVRSVDSRLTEQERFSAQAVPGWVLSTDMTGAKLFIVAPADTTRITVNFSGTGALELTPIQLFNSTSSSPYTIYAVKPLQAGRVRATFSFSGLSAASATHASVSWFILPPLQGHVASVGAFSAANQWLNDSSDPFGRGQSIMPYDFEAKAMVMQDERSYVVGLSDEAGAGPGLAFAMANRYHPVQAQVELMDRYVNETLLGVKGGEGSPVPFPTSVQNANWSVRASMFWYDKPGMPGYKYTVRDGWDQDRGAQLWRSYNYVHPTVLYHTLYRICRDFDLLPRLYPCVWYLTAAYNTFEAMQSNAPYYVQFGLMEGSVFLDVQADLELEGLSTESQAMQKAQQRRVNTWARLPFPFGSEMPWDSTGQEEIWLSAQQFGEYKLANSSLAAILAYAHAVPNWAYHGSARRFWDFWINGKASYTQPWPERNLHHYGSSLNGKPLLRAYEMNPNDFYVLQVGIGAMTGVLTNIQPGGATSMGFHADNAILKHDPFDADYGCALYGHVTSASSYFVLKPEFFFPSCFLCDAQQASGRVYDIVPRDSLHRRMYLEPIGSSVEVEAGSIVSVRLDLDARVVTVTLAAAVSFSTHRVKVLHWARCQDRPGCGLSISSPKVQMVRGAWTFPATNAQATVNITWSAKSEPALQSQYPLGIAAE